MNNLGNPDKYSLFRKLRPPLMTVVAILAVLWMAYAILSSGPRALAQGDEASENGLTPTVASTEGPARSDEGTVAVEICSEDPETGEVSCVQDRWPAGVTVRRGPPAEGSEEQRACEVDPGVGQACYEEIDLEGLASTITLATTNFPGEDDFDVELDYLDPDYDYDIRVRGEYGNDSYGFDSNGVVTERDCRNVSITIEVPGDDDAPDYYDYSYTFTVVGCEEGGGDVTAELLRNNSVLLTDRDSVSVVDRRPTPTYTPEPTEIPEPPDPPTGLRLGFEDDDDDDDDLELEFRRSGPPHFYDFRLEQARRESGSYREVEDEEAVDSPVDFRNVERDRWY